MADKTFKKNKTKQTTNSAKDNLITITRIDCNNGNLENNDQFNVPLEILLNNNNGIKNITKNITMNIRSNSCFTYFTMTILIAGIILKTFLTYQMKEILHLRKTKCFRANAGGAVKNSQTSK